MHEHPRARQGHEFNGSYNERPMARNFSRRCSRRSNPRSEQLQRIGDAARRGIDRLRIAMRRRGASMMPSMIRGRAGPAPRSSCWSPHPSPVSDLATDRRRPRERSPNRSYASMRRGWPSPARWPRPNRLRDDRNDRHPQPEAGRGGAGNGLGLGRASAPIPDRRGRVHQRDHRKGEPVRKLHDADGLAISFRAGHAEIVLQPAGRVIALLLPITATDWPTNRAKPAMTAWSSPTCDPRQAA